MFDYNIDHGYISNMDAFCMTLFRFTVDELDATLNIVAGQYTDSGEYGCTVTIVSQGGNQTLYSTFYLEVEGKRSTYYDKRCDV